MSHRKKKDSKRSADESLGKYKGIHLRGVSKNGRCNWQILSQNENTKTYLGTVDNILKAAILYDILSIQAKGLKAKTNFSYTRTELNSVMTLQDISSIKSNFFQIIND
jgi:hypothetical protein